MDYYLCMQVLLKRPICEQWPFPRCPNIKIAPQLLFAEPVTVRRAAAEPASCPGARCAGHRPPLTAPPASPRPRPPRAPLPTGRATCPRGPAPSRNPRPSPFSWVLAELPNLGRDPPFPLRIRPGTKAESRGIRPGTKAESRGVRPGTKAESRGIRPDTKAKSRNGVAWTIHIEWMVSYPRSSIS
ncbi:atherin-like [Zalophus californianus]|uniref:Atherin-like n=1 Tax=Zalophus californianus TaxID=9704 RepID=A0A6J2CQ60_ZALCA|nr:atherin-like [Zalophus californianus]